MRIAIVSDIHGNRTAFEATLRDLRVTSPDLILHGGDLADGGSSPVEIVDRVRDLGWAGVGGNTDELLVAPAAFEAFAASLPRLSGMFGMVREMAEFTRAALGEERLAWLSRLPAQQVRPEVTLVHASPASLWRAPTPEASEAELEAAYAEIAAPLVVYGHIHRPFLRRRIANAGSVSLSYDGDRRASYLLIDDGKPSIRRVEYDIEAEGKALRTSGLPHAEWVARTLASGVFEMP